MRSSAAYTPNWSQILVQRERLRYWLGYAILILLLLSLIDGLMPQAEMALFSGHVLIPTVAVKWFMMAIMILGVFIRSKLVVPRKVLYAWTVLVFYLLFEAMFFALNKEYSLNYIVYSLEATLYFLLVLPLLYAFKDVLEESKITTMISWLFAPLVFLGIWQGATNHPILPIMSADHYFQVFSWDFYGRVRAFSLFSSASNFGHFLALVSAMCVAALSQWRGYKKTLATTGLILSLVATYMTLTRATYVEVLLAVTTAGLITFFKWRDIRLSLLWGLYAAIGLFVAFGSHLILAGLTGGNQLLANESLLMRYEEWAHYGGLWINHDIATMLFGTGLMQSSRFAITRDVVIDNVWLSLLFQFGLVGFIIVLAFLWQLWKILVNGLKSHPQSILTIGVVSACSTFPFTSIFGITTLGYLLLFVVWLISKKT
ncbi:MAG: hypothetical protein AB7C98_04010 [Acidithiobacillus sp.]